MRAFFVLGLFFLVFLVVMTNTLADLDLTPSTAIAVQADASPVVPLAAPDTSQPQNISIQPGPTVPSQSSALLPNTGGCSNPYTVRAGDTLSQIAVNCNSTLAALTRANPQMMNVNCIYPGQQINIYEGGPEQTTVNCRVEAVISVAPPQACACDLAPAAASEPAPAPLVLTPLLLTPMVTTGAELQIRAINFPPNTPVNVAIGPRTVGYSVVTSGVTDASGSLTTVIVAPSAPDAQTAWVVVVVTTNQPLIQVMSEPFYIQP